MKELTTTQALELLLSCTKKEKECLVYFWNSPEATPHILKGVVINAQRPYLMVSKDSTHERITCNRCYTK
jgi:hypothetical protein